LSDSSIINLKHLSSEQIWDLKVGRWKARTDLGWLCRNILGFEHVTDASSAPCKLEDGPDLPIHQPIIDILQRFPTPAPEQFQRNDRVMGGRWEYTPITPMLKLPGGRRVLILDPRGFLKTTINVVAHTIQWIINYPDIAMMIIQSNSEKASDFLRKIKQHFQSNPRFRQLFPEHCPTKKVFDWGTNERFTSEARSPMVMRSEPTVMAGSIEKGGSGIHVDVMKFSDIVEPSNITGNGKEVVKTNFYMMQNLLVGPSYWIDVEGTRYAYGDLYGDIIEHEMKQPVEKRMYKIHARGCFVKDKAPELVTNTPEELEAPNLVNASGKRVPLWPRRFPLEGLEDAEARDPFTFATQQLNNPSAGIKGGRPFPVENGEFERRVIPRDKFTQNVRVAYKEISVDFAYTTGHRADYTAIVLATFDHYGRCYVEQIEHGRFLPDQALGKLFLMVLSHLRHLRCVKIENTAFTHGIMPSFRRLLDVPRPGFPDGIHVPVVLVPRDSDKSKEERIMQTLQPWYKSSDLRFVIDPPEIKTKGISDETLAQLRKELMEFPSGNHDDILDAVSDLFQDKEWFGREMPHLMSPEEKKHYYSQRTKEVMSRQWELMLGADPTPEDAMYMDASPFIHPQLSRTGGL